MKEQARDYNHPTGPQYAHLRNLTEEEQAEMIAMETYTSDFEPFNAACYGRFPSTFTGCFRLFQTLQEAEVFLAGAMGVLSSLMPNVYGNYMGMPMAPNLYGFVVGAYGSGKGSLVLARMLGEAVHKYRVAQARDMLRTHADEQRAYQRSMKLYDKGKLAEPPTTPKAPVHLKHYLPANNSKTGVLQLLSENGGRGMILETEGDTLSDMLRQDYGNFSDILRKAFHHEPLSFFRRAESEDSEVPHPCLSVLLSGTHEQLYRLIPSIENGLYSRFYYYIMQGDAHFMNPFDKDKTNYVPHMQQVGERMLDMYKLLEQRSENPVQFSLSAPQQEMFIKHFAACKEEIRTQIGTELDGTVHRMGNIFFRMAMILSVVRAFDNNHIPTQLVCSDGDFGLALQLHKHYMQYGLKVYEYLMPAHTVEETTSNEVSHKKGEKDEWCRLHKLGHNAREIARQMYGSIKKKSTIFTWTKCNCK